MCAMGYRKEEGCGLNVDCFLISLLNLKDSSDWYILAFRIPFNLNTYLGH